jgi:hypothetical protein
MFTLNRVAVAAGLAALLLAAPAVVPFGGPQNIAQAAETLTKDQQAKVDQAFAKIQKAFDMVKGRADFIRAVNAKDAKLVKQFLMKDGAPDAFGDIQFDGPGKSAKLVIIKVSARCCPPQIVIVIKY